MGGLAALISAGGAARSPATSAGALSTSLPACTSRLMQGGWGQPEGARPRLRASRAWALLVVLATSVLNFMKLLEQMEILKYER